jgi:hypothetical protein
MPRPSEVQQTAVGKLRLYNRTNKLSYDVAYHLQMAALAADGKVAIGIDPDAPAVEQLSAEDQKSLADAKRAIGI